MTRTALDAGGAPLGQIKAIGGQGGQPASGSWSGSRSPESRRIPRVVRVAGVVGVFWDAESFCGRNLRLTKMGRATRSSHKPLLQNFLRYPDHPDPYDQARDLRV